MSVKPLCLFSSREVGAKIEEEEGEDTCEIKKKDARMGKRKFLATYKKEEINKINVNVEISTNVLETIFTKREKTCYIFVLLFAIDKISHPFSRLTSSLCNLS